MLRPGLLKRRLGSDDGILRDSMSGTGSRSRPSLASGIVYRLPLLAVMACAAFVFSGSLAYFFSQDDFAALARARGLLDPLPGLWRWLSGTAYFSLMRPLGLSAGVYHAVNLLAHAACAGILYALLRRRFSAPAAFLGALFFGAHPALYTAVYWVSTLNEILALLFALLSIACAARPGATAWASVPLFALSLLSKETTLLLPAALWISPGWLDGPEAPVTAGNAARGRRARVRIALSGVALAYLAYWLGNDAFGTRDHLEAAAPYAVGMGRHILVNAVTYLGWTGGMLLPTTRRFEDIAEPALWPWAAALGGLWLAGFLFARLRASGWLAGGATLALLVAPVLSLRNHTYHYYLYAPLIGAAWCAAALADAWFRAPATTPERPGRVAPAPAGRPGPAASAPRPVATGRAPKALEGLAWPLALCAGTFIVLNGALLVRKIENMPFVDGRLRADPIVDRARIARRVYDGLAASAIPDGARLVFWSPASMRYERRLHPEADVIGKETYWERNVRVALQDGLAVRVMFPQVDSVEFLHAYRPAGEDARFVLYEPDGTVEVKTPAHLDSVLRQAAAGR